MLQSICVNNLCVLALCDFHTCWTFDRFDDPISRPTGVQVFQSWEQRAKQDLLHKMSVLMCADYMHVSDGVLLVRFASMKSRNSASLAWRCAGNERESNLLDLEDGINEGLCPYTKKNGETPVAE